MENKSRVNDQNVLESFCEKTTGDKNFYNSSFLYKEDNVPKKDNIPKILSNSSYITYFGMVGICRYYDFSHFNIQSHETFNIKIELLNKIYNFENLNKFKLYYTDYCDDCGDGLYIEINNNPKILLCDVVNGKISHEGINHGILTVDFFKSTVKIVESVTCARD